MYIKNSMGPRTVPWGTPERTGWEEDCVPSETTLCDLPCNFLNPGMCGSSDAVPVELILKTSMWDLIESFTEIHDDQIML